MIRTKGISRNMLVTRAARLNDFSSLNPVLWANEALVQLQPRMVLGNLIHRDFDNVVTKFGDIVNAFIPSTFTMSRKGDLLENVVDQDASGTTVQVPCNQWPYVSFVIPDGDEDRNFLDLAEVLLTPAVNALALGIDRICASRIIQFLANNSGQLGTIDDTVIEDYLLDTKGVLDYNNVPDDGRVMMITSKTERAGLKNHLFVAANERGDGGNALKTANLGNLYNFEFYRAASTPSIGTGQTAQSTTLTAGASAGATVINVTSATNLATGMWLTVAGDGVPQQITAINTLALTITPGLARDVANGAAVKALRPAAVNNAAGYSGPTTSPRFLGYAKEIAIDGITALPKIGQFVTFGTDTRKYTIIGASDKGGGNYGITLDRPLEATIADNAAVNFAPQGEYNFAFLRNAFAMINRPLPQPRAGTGAAARVVSDPRGKLSMRVTITYDGKAQGHRVVIDTLMGVGTLNSALGCVMLG